jgi:hypothetical protein
MTRYKQHSMPADEDEAFARYHWLVDVAERCMRPAQHDLRAIGKELTAVERLVNMEELPTSVLDEVQERYDAALAKVNKNPKYLAALNRADEFLRRLAQAFPLDTDDKEQLS